jgi:hypothetical protein
LLCFVESVDFVDEKQGFLLLGRKAMFRFGQHVAELFHAIGDGRELPKDAAAGLGKNVSECCFAGAGRTVKNNRAKPVGSEQAAEQFSFAEKVLLPDEFVERLRTHSHGKRLGFPAVFAFFCGKKMGHSDSNVYNVPDYIVDRQFLQYPLLACILTNQSVTPYNSCADFF